ncbi:SNW domain-containing protein 1, partial [Geodia barretti]
RATVKGQKPLGFWCVKFLVLFSLLLLSPVSSKRIFPPSKMSLTKLLPRPAHVTVDPDEPSVDAAYAQLTRPTVKKEPPPYGHRKNWVPRSLADFGDGGAFPEVHVAQYPMNMANKSKPGSSSAVVPLQLDASGKVKYDVLARMGQRKDKVVHSSLEAMVSRGVRPSDPELVRPEEEEVEKVTEETRLALEKLTNKKISAAMPVRAADKQAPAQYIRYTPAQQGVAYNSGAKQRIIRMVEAQKDPMEPPRFKVNQKIPRGPPSPPAPVLHSPTRKVSPPTTATAWYTLCVVHCLIDGTLFRVHFYLPYRLMPTYLMD